MKSKPHCLVTGGAGFIGSHFCDHLLEKGFAVTALDDLSLGRMSNLSLALKTPGFTFIKGDILKPGVLDSVFKGKKYDTVFHLAANSDIQGGGKETDRDLKLTFLTTFKVLDAMRRFRVRKLVFASSSAIYGPVKVKINEEYGPLQPVSFYGAGKLASEAYISAFVNLYDMRAWVFRFPNVVGNRLTHGVVYDFINKLREKPNRLLILGNGNQRKPYLHVRDLIDAMELCRKRLKGRFNCVNIGVESSTTVKRIAKIIVREMGLNRVAVRYTGGEGGWRGDIPFYQYDLTRIKRIGWKVTYSSDEAIRESVRECLGK